jgi:hypothetical protein
VEKFFFDLFGWFTTDAAFIAAHPRRFTTTPPPTVSETTTPGQPRPNWTGYTWNVLPYAVGQLPDQEAPVPATVERWMLRIAMISAGKLATIESALAALPGGAQKVVLTNEWNHRETFTERSPVLRWVVRQGIMTGPEMRQVIRDTQSILSEE